MNQERPNRLLDRIGAAIDDLAVGGRGTCVAPGREQGAEARKEASEVGGGIEEA